MTPRRHGVIPDTQVKPGVSIAHLGWAGQYLAEKRPDVLIHLGDWMDCSSLSSYDIADNPSEYHQRRYEMDLLAGDLSVDVLEAALTQGRRYRPRKVYLLGNHEDRYTRLILAQPKLAGALKPPWAHAQKRGWEIVPFLQPMDIDGILYSHFFPRGPNGSVTNSRNGAPSARVQVQREMQSCVAGHKQGLDSHIQNTSRGMMRGIQAGSYYDHEEGYLTPQGTVYWRGILLLTEVMDGSFNLVEVSLEYLRRKYGRAHGR